MTVDIGAMREIHRQAVIARDWEDFELVVDHFPAILDELESARDEIALLRGLLGSCGCIPKDAI